MTTERGDSMCMDDEGCGCGPEVEFGDDRLDPIQLSVRTAAFRLLLDSGQPASIASVAGAANVDPTTATHILEGFAGTGNVSIDGDQLMGITGLTVAPTRHRIEVAAGRRWTWCALDAVGIVGAVGDGVIHSEMADALVRLEVKDGALETTELAVFVADSYGITSAIDQWCPLVNFFPNVAAATAWAEKEGIKGRAFPVRAVAARLIERWRSVLDHHQPVQSDAGGVKSHRRRN